uniref:Uncharacterized protein n=1 Tax=viral metagenome TaxID=1070528 RepID=A0A6C0BL41_9ZZZZ
MNDQFILYLIVGVITRADSLSASVITSTDPAVIALILRNDRSCANQPANDTLTEPNSDIFTDCEI